MKRTMLATILVLSACSGFSPAYAGESRSIFLNCQGEKSVMTITKNGNLYMDKTRLIIPNGEVSSANVVLKNGEQIAIVSDGVDTVGLQYRVGRTKALVQDNTTLLTCNITKVTKVQGEF